MDKAFRERIRVADAVLFVTPEHNRSVPGKRLRTRWISWLNVLMARTRGAAMPALAVVSASPGGIGGFWRQPDHLRQSLVFLNVPARWRSRRAYGSGGAR